MKVWLDDERDPKDLYIQSHFGSDGDEVWAKTADVAIAHLATGRVTSISLDHDLGMSKTGMDVAKYIEEQAFLGNLPRLVWNVHSLNPVGRQNIIRAMMKAEEYWRNHDAIQG